VLAGVGREVTGVQQIVGTPQALGDLVVAANSGQHLHVELRRQRVGVEFVVEQDDAIEVEDLTDRGAPPVDGHGPHREAIRYLLGVVQVGLGVLHRHRESVRHEPGTLVGVDLVAPDARGTGSTSVDVDAAREAIDPLVTVAVAGGRLLGRGEHRTGIGLRVDAVMLGTYPWQVRAGRVPKNSRMAFTKPTVARE